MSEVPPTKPRGRRRKNTAENEMLDAIMGRLNAIEGRLSANVENVASISQPCTSGLVSSVPRRHCSTPPRGARSSTPLRVNNSCSPPRVRPHSPHCSPRAHEPMRPSPCPPTACAPRRSLSLNTRHVDGAAGVGRAVGCDVSMRPPEQNNAENCGNTVVDVTEKILGVLSSFAQVKPTHYFISSFDPRLHDFDVWCAEVDKAREVNRWGSNECLSRVAGCLKGDARQWLNEWVTNDRSWHNFKTEFRYLCPKNVDVANILFDVMRTDSNNYTTYAEYARRALLRLNIVTGLSDDLRSAIVIRGITDPQIKAAASNAKLKPNELVEFLSVYTKPKGFSRANHESRSFRNDVFDSRKRNSKHFDHRQQCFSCGGFGHKRPNCSKRPRTEPAVPSRTPAGNKTPSTNGSLTNTVSQTVAPSTGTANRSSLSCSYCHKPGHVIDTCFAKQRVESSSKRSKDVNLCQKSDSTNNSDVIAAVIQGVPVDVLVDSGSSVSLISEVALKHFDCNRVPSYRVMRGIGSQEIESTYCVDLILEFPEISLEVEFHVVPSQCMSVPVLIGTDVLNREGVTYIRSGAVQRLLRIENPIVVQHLREVDINVRTDLEGEEKQRLLAIINEFSNSFISGTATSTVKTGSMQIRLTNDMPIHYRPYKLSHDEKLRVREIVSDLKSKGIIRESESAYASPIILVKKKDGSDRMCVDFRALNAITVKDRYPLPLIDDHIDRLGKAKFFTSLDMATGFHQIQLSPDSINKTAFVTPEGHYEYLKMPYGLANAPVVFQRIITETLKPLIDTGKVLVYIDDVLVLSDTIDEGLIELHKVLDLLTSAGFSLNLKKCSFLSSEVEYLGRLISCGQVRPSPRKIDALIKAPKPTNVKQVRQFLGLAGYFRRYIANYSTKTACIAMLTKKGVPFVWGSEQENARAYIIGCLTSEPVLAIFDPSLPTELHTDASAVGYGAVLLQEHENKTKHVIGYFSRATHGAESKYHSYELETLAIIKALQHFRHYLLGISFKIVTDCNSLKLTERKKDLVPRVARWWIYMQDFKFEIEYRKGVLMSHADYLSRNPVEVLHIRKPVSWAQAAQSADAETQILIEKLRDGQLDTSRYEVRNNLLYYKYSPTGDDTRLLCFIPKGHRLSLLRIFHDEHCHIGINKTLDLILRHFWFPGLTQFVKKYVTHCLTCLSHKKVPRAPHQPIESWSKPNVPFSTVHMDVLGPLPESKGFKYVLIIVDAFSKYCLLYALYRQDADELKRVVTSAVALFGTPSLIVNDRGRMFESSSYQEWVTSLGCITHFITPEMHRENGQVERYCRTVLNLLRVEVGVKGSDWSDVLWKVQLTLNITKHATTQVSALQLLTGVDATTPVLRSLVRDVALENSHPNRLAMMTLRRQRASELLNANQKRQDETVNEGRRHPYSYKVGDLAFVKKTAQITGKFDSGMRGPYKVVKELPHHRYELELLGGSYGKRTQAASEYMVRWRGEWTPDTCSAFFETEEEHAVEDASQSGTAVSEENENCEQNSE